MKIAVIGSGHVGGTLGKRWARGGHQLAFSSRNPESDEMKQLLTDAGPSARAASVEDAVHDADVVVIATPWAATKDALQNAGNLSGKTVIDATNPLLPDLSGLELGTNTSAAEQVATWAKGAKVVKAFNTIGFNIMADPNINGQPALLFYCGDDAGAKDTVKQLASELGFAPFDAGPLKQARVLEPFALLWISLAMKHGREFAFQIIRR